MEEEEVWWGDSNSGGRWGWSGDPVALSQGDQNQLTFWDAILVFDCEIL